MVAAEKAPNSYIQYRAKMLELHDKGVKPPKDSPFIGTWGKKGDDWVYDIRADGTMTITKPGGEVMKGTWVHEEKVERVPPIAVYRVDDYATKLWIRDGKICIDCWDTWFELRRSGELSNPNPKNEKPAEQPGTGQPATKPADKVPAEVQRHPPTPKDVPR